MFADKDGAYLSEAPDWLILKIRNSRTKSFIGFAPVGPHTLRIELPGCFGINKLATNYLHLLLGLDRQTEGQIDRYSGRKTDRQMEKEREKDKDG